MALKRDYLKLTGDFQQALETADSIQIIQEKRLTRERNNYSVFMDAKFENSAKVQEIEQLETDNQLRQSRLKCSPEIRTTKQRKKTQPSNRLKSIVLLK